jgi:hypothetical protein
MELEYESFRWGIEHMHQDETAWTELISELEKIERADVMELQVEHFLDWKNRGTVTTPKVPPVGAQSTINKLIRTKLVNLNFESQIYVFKGRKLTANERKASNSSEEASVPYWSMDFKKDRVGVEISFNNAGALAQNLLRLSVMSESKLLDRSDQIKLGVLVVATEELRLWGGMDDTVITLEQVRKILPHITFSIPTPIAIVGMKPWSNGVKWPTTHLFGNAKANALPPFSKLDSKNQSLWEDRISHEISLLNPNQS